MQRARIVIGSGPDALRAAAVRATTPGAPVALVQEGEAADGLGGDELAMEPARLSIDPDLVPLATRILGPLSPRRAPDRALWTPAGVLPVPAARRDAIAVLKRLVGSEGPREWARARLRNGLAELVGGGQEERTHRDWVVRRVGPAAWEGIYAPYAEARWGAPSDALAASLARHAHAVPEPHLGLHPDLGASDRAARALAEIEAGGGRASVGVSVRRLEAGGGGPACVELTNGDRLEADGAIWVASAPRRVVEWLGAAAPAELVVDSARLPAATVHRVCAAGRLTAARVDELHLLGGPGAPWRLTQSAADEQIVAHLTAPVGSATQPPVASDVVRQLNELGLVDADASGARLITVSGWQPVWLEGCHAALRRVLVRYADLGLVAVGRAGTFSPLGLGAEIAVAHHLATQPGGPLEVQRTVAQPCARMEDLGAGLDRFVTA